MWHGERNVSEAERHVVWAPWSPAQIVALVLGGLYAILGGVALARAGIGGNTFTQSHVGVLGFSHTALLGVIELVYGLLLIMAGAVPGAGRGTMVFLGALALGFGIVVLAAADSLYAGLGVRDANGWLYIVTGVATLIAAMTAPLIYGAEQRSTAYRDDALHRHR